jgi:hypothetical protein
MYIEGEAQMYCKENFSASPNTSWDLYAWFIGGKQVIISPRVEGERESGMLKGIPTDPDGRKSQKSPLGQISDRLKCK